jgi:hypothetical protein
VTERITQHQYVMNTLTGAWSRFTNMNAGCWSLLGTDLYFGGNDGKVYKFDTGYQDNGSNIVARIQTAYTNFNSSQQKKFNLAKPYFIAPSGYVPRVSILTDFNVDPATLTTATTLDLGPEWDEEFWDEPYWGSTSVPVYPWEGLESAAGVSASVAFSVSYDAEIVFNGVDVVYEEGGLL